jgi:hypothetical protein
MSDDLEVCELVRYKEPSKWDRFLKLAENGFVQTAIGILGGLMAAFVYGPILAICAVLVVTGLHRSGAVDGIRLRSRVAWYVSTLLVTGAILVSCGRIIERHRDHIPTVAEIVAALGNNPRNTPSKTPAPIVQTAPQPTVKPRDIYHVPISDAIATNDSVKAKTPPAAQDNSVHVEGGGKIDQQSNGDCSPNMIGGSNTVNCGPPPIVLQVVSLDTNPAQSRWADKPGFVKTEIKITSNQPIVAPFFIELDFDNPISEIVNSVENVGVQFGGGTYRLGTHARDTVTTSIGPHHPLLVVVWSTLPVKLVNPPRVEY